MKNIITILTAVFLFANVFAQSPEKISYQSIIRNNNGQLMVNTDIGIQISILQGGPNNSATYIERHYPKTNENGLATIEIGSGIIEYGIFNNIDWANGPFFIKTETDLNGGTNYTIIGTSQLLSVPFSLYSSKANFSNNSVLLNGQPGSYYSSKTIQSYSPGCYGDCPELPTGSTNPVTINSVTITVPGPGNIFVSFNGFVSTNQSGYLYVVSQLLSSSNENPSSIYDGGNSVRAQVPSGSGYINYSMNSSSTFSVSAAGTYTFYNRAKYFSTGSVSCKFYSGNMSAIFTQNQ